MTPEIIHPVPELHGSRLVRLLCIATGMIALALGILGIFLPLLPTTVFILAAAACFARGSERLHDRILAHPIAGPVIREWREHRAMPARAKRVALALVVISFSVSILIVPTDSLRVMLLAIGLTIGFFLWRAPVRG